MSFLELNTNLIEEFSNLERLCCQIYNEKQYGVTCYIDDMERKYGANLYVNDWRCDLKRLKEIRHKRNQLSHGEVSFQSFCANQDDINFLIDFRRRILNGSDPLSQYRRFIQTNSSSAPSSNTNFHTHSARPPRQSIGCTICITLVSVITVAVIWLTSLIL